VAGYRFWYLRFSLEGKLDSNPKYMAAALWECFKHVYLPWYNSFPIARLGDNEATDLIVEDFNRWGIDTRFYWEKEKEYTYHHRILQPKIRN